MVNKSSLPPHPILQTPADLQPSKDQGLVYLAAGCFWGVERILWNTPGVVATTVGYMGGTTPNPNYVAVCTGLTGHAEAVRVVYDRRQITDADLFAVFWENHDSTQLNRQGNDIGTQYRSAIWTTDDAQSRAAEAVKAAYQEKLTAAGHGAITTIVESASPRRPFYEAEEYHQAYLFVHKDGYCNHGFNGVSCPTGVLS